jgi:DNA polymerase epsilon subunit 1
MLNIAVQQNYSNHQYQQLKPGSTHQYETRSECSILFEVDGPYKAMVKQISWNMIA